MRELLEEIKFTLESWNGETLYYVSRCGEPTIVNCEDDAVEFDYTDLIKKIDEKLELLNEIEEMTNDLQI